MKPPLFSIIIPTLGKVTQWSWAIESVLRQTFRDFEIVAIDSGPEEQSAHAIARFNDPRIISVNTAAGNPRLNWDVGFRHSQGAYVLWLDDDNCLLPHALQKLADTIEKTHADVVSGEHIHYRGPDHVIRAVRNQLVIPIRGFTNTVYPVDPKDVVRKLLGTLPKDRIRARFHGSENAVKREIIEMLLSRIGEINFETTSTYALRLGIFVLARSVYVIDSPIALIAQSARSMTDTWPYIDSPVLHKVVFRFDFSPVKAHTYDNYRHDQYLRIQHALRDIAPNMEINETIFFQAHARALIFLDQSWREWHQGWKELWRVTRTSQNPEIRSITKKIPYLVTIGFAVKIAKMLRIYPLFQLLFTSYRRSKKPQHLISVTPYGVTNIYECVEKLPEIVQKELGI